MIITYTDSARHGECAECGKRFIRRAIDAADDGKLCRDCYLKQKQKRKEPDETELIQTYDAGFKNGVMAVFQQLEGIESYEELQDLIAEYWGEGEGYDER